MKTTTITILLLVASLFAHGQINNNSTRTNSNGDVHLRRYSAGDTAWKRALVVGYNSSNSNGKLYLNYAGDFKDGLRIDGSHVNVSGKLGVNSNNPIGKLDVRMDKNWSNAAIVIPNTNDANPKFIFYRPTGYKQTSYPWYLEAQGPDFHIKTGGHANIGAESVTSKMTFKSNGNVGIGTTYPDQKLTVKGSVNIGGTGNATLRLRHIEGKHPQNANYDNLFLNYSSGKNVYVGNPYNHNLRSNMYVTGQRQQQPQRTPLFAPRLFG